MKITFVFFHKPFSSVSWTIPSLFRITSSYKYDFRKNAVQFGDEKAVIQAINLDSRLTSKSLGSVQVRGTFAQIFYSGEENQAVSFVMLDALQKGQNWLWFLSWERQVGKGIEISLEYDGRKSGDHAIIHTRRTSIRALL